MASPGRRGGVGPHHDCGAGNDDPTSNIVIENNRFGQQYFSQIGQYGPDADFDPTGPGNIWSGNIGDITGDAIAY